jgi:protocatechuate 3,4-dioxygenase beta subunit
MKNTNLL